MKQIPIKITNWAKTGEEPTAELNVGISPACLARDWKGFSNYGMAAVLVLGDTDGRHKYFEKVG